MSLTAKTCTNDSFHFHQTMQQEDCTEFIKAIVKELEVHYHHKYWKLIKQHGSLLKHKAWLNVHGGMQVYGKNY